MTGPEINPDQPELTGFDKSPEQLQIELSTIQFVVNGIKLSLQQNALTRAEAVKMIKGWYPDAVINLTDL